MKSQTTRRRLLQASGGALASVSLLRTGSIGRGAAARQATIEIRAAGFVESQDQLRQTLAVLEAYTAQHPEVAIQPEFTDYGSYTDRLATEAAGGNAPDLMSANADIMGEYSRRGVIRPLDEYVPDPIDLSDYAEGTVVGNTIDGSLFGIPNDCISPSLVYDTTVFAEAGITVPEQMWTWEEYAQLATDLSAAMGEGFYGTEDGGGSYIMADVFFRGMGKEFYSADRNLGFTEEDLTAWYDFWQQLRESGGTPPGDVQALATGDDLSRTGLIAGRAAILPQLTDTFVGLQNLTENPLGLHMVPNGFDGDTLEQHLYTYAGNSSSISAQTEHADVVIDIISFMHSDPEGSAIFYSGSGMIPAAAAGREALRAEGSPGEITALDYIELILPSTAPPRNPAVAGVSPILGRMNEEVAFGRLTTAEAAAQFFAEAASRIS
ncbi:MAG: extracellular solute-binding protein [Chloroflexota bacterium]|nr:extracellular solute-binding protein [Chloroflexota bacterium]